jgi:hypothetical protein
MWHSDDGLRGGLMREANYLAYPLIGLECAGWFDPPPYPGNFGAYTCTNQAAPLFNTPIKTGLQTGDQFGYIDAANDGVVGHEYDIRVSNPQMFTVPPDTESPPTGATIPCEPPNIQTLAQALMSPTISAQQPNTVFDYFVRWYDAPSPPLLTAEMIYWARPAGGQVFHAGAIGSGWALSYDPVMQNLMSNVMALFGVKPASSQKPKRSKVNSKSLSKRPSKKGGRQKKSSTARPDSGRGRNH